MTRFTWALIAAVVISGGCGQDEDGPWSNGNGGKGDDFLGQMAQQQLETFQVPYARVGQDADCSAECLKLEDLSMKRKCCDKFKPDLSKVPNVCAQSAVAPKGQILVEDSRGIKICQMPAGHQVSVPFKYCKVGQDDVCPPDQKCVEAVNGELPSDLDLRVPGNFDAAQAPYNGVCKGENEQTGREVMDYQNMPYRLHEDLQRDAYTKFDDRLLACNDQSTDKKCRDGLNLNNEIDVFASQWWPQSKNGIAWRWTGGDSNYNADKIEDTTKLSPSEKYELLTGDGLNTDLTTSGCTPVTLAGKTFCPVKLGCGSNKTEQKEVDGVMVDMCVNYSWKDKQEEDESNPISQQMYDVVGKATKWEMENHGKYQNVQPDSWWGHCNGWASYATAEPLGYPERDVCVRWINNTPQHCINAAENGAGTFNANTGEFDSAIACGTGDTADCVLMRMGDIEALMSEVYFSDAATFVGRRCNKMPDDIEMDEFGRPKEDQCRDINAGTFHIAVTGMLGSQTDEAGNVLSEGVTPYAGGDKKKLSFVIDHNYDYQVWNFPLVNFRFKSVADITGGTPELCPLAKPEDPQLAQKRQDYQKWLDDNSQGDNPTVSNPPTAENCAAYLVSKASNGKYIDQFNSKGDTQRYVFVTMVYQMVSDGVSTSSMRRRADQRGSPAHDHEMNYILEIDRKGNITGGEWTKNRFSNWGSDNKTAHPDFLWAAIKPAAQGGTHDLNDSDNPYLNYNKIKALLQLSKTDFQNPPPPPEPAEHMCKDKCGQTVGNCFCAADCSADGYKDCCQRDGKQGTDNTYVGEVC